MFKKKSLGQHFLTSGAHLRAVADAADIQSGERVIEIGPGDGALTEVLLERGARVMAIEKDSRLISLLREKFAGKDFEVVEADALEYDITGKNLKVIGNIPYYITGALLRKYLSDVTQPTRLVFLMQKEVAERIARSKKESILSLSVKVYGTPKYVRTVPAGAFSPPPKVDSAILSVSDISRENFADKDHETRFFELLKTGFGQKRKQLKSTLKSQLGDKAESLGTRRAEDVSLEEWLELAKIK